QMADVALEQHAHSAFHASKLGTARFYFARLLPRIQSLSATVKAGSASLFLLDAEQL
ncbi:MAG TPA: acyl-CoA dehydrogenase C-terminal domain-containing protein, partial [Pseudomonas sp.]|nr:acyl-CoA dehydrogenase C-terminal domain-containing protein [Pseudomonas sp.]